MELDNGIAEPSEGLAVADGKRAWRVLPAKENSHLATKKERAICCLTTPWDKGQAPCPLSTHYSFQGPYAQDLRG